MLRRFVDANVLLYSVSRDPKDAAKLAVAKVIVDDSDLAVSAQVLQEFYTQAVRPSRPKPLSDECAWSIVEAFILKYPVLPTTVEHARKAWLASERFQISYWDAAILDAAREIGCTTVLTEDLNHGQGYGGVRVTNPFI
jgi:predicted nucleic acid-binding protein